MSNQTGLSAGAEPSRAARPGFAAESLSLIRRLTPLSWCLIATAVGGPALYGLASLEGVKAPASRFTQSVGEALRESVQFASRSVAAISASPSTPAAPAAKLPDALPVKPVAAPCLTVAPSEDAALAKAVHTTSSLDCVPPAQQQQAAAGSPQPAALATAPAAASAPSLAPSLANNPAIKVAPLAAARPVEAAAAPTPVVAPRPVAVSHARPVNILNKGASVPPPEGMKAPTFAASGESAGESRAEPRLGVTSAAPVQQFNGPGAGQVQAGAKGTVQSAQLPGQIGGVANGNRPPERLPWLEPDGTSRRSALGRTESGGSGGSVQILGKSLSTKPARWSEDLYKSRQ